MLLSGRSRVAGKILIITRRVKVAGYELKWTSVLKLFIDSLSLSQIVKQITCKLIAKTLKRLVYSIAVGNELLCVATANSPLHSFFLLADTPTCSHLPSTATNLFP